MKIYEGKLAPHQIEAGIAVMKGQFTASRVMSALQNAGVVNCLSGADVLIGREIRNGNIRRVTQGIYEKLGG